MDSSLLGRWIIISEEGKPSDEKIEFLFLADHTMEFLKNDESQKGVWRVLQGKNESLLSVRLEPEKNESILTIQFKGDSLYLSFDDENAVFLKVR